MVPSLVVVDGKTIRWVRDLSAEEHEEFEKASCLYSRKRSKINFGSFHSHPPPTASGSDDLPRAEQYTANAELIT